MIKMIVLFLKDNETRKKFIIKFNGLNSDFNKSMESLKNEHKIENIEVINYTIKIDQYMLEIIPHFYETENIEEFIYNLGTLAHNLENKDYENRYVILSLIDDQWWIKDILATSLTDITWLDMTLEDLAHEEIKEEYEDENIPELFFDYFDYKAYARNELVYRGWHETKFGVYCTD